MPIAAKVAAARRVDKTTTAQRLGRACAAEIEHLG
jgi:hypothetical protein